MKQIAFQKFMFITLWALARKNSSKLPAKSLFSETIGTATEVAPFPSEDVCVKMHRVQIFSARATLAGAQIGLCG